MRFTYLALEVCGDSAHVVVHGGQHGDGLFGHVHSGEDHGGLRDAGQPGGQLLGRQVVELQVHVVLLGTDTPEGRERKTANDSSSLSQGFKVTESLSLHLVAYLPSLISMVMERDTTSLEARSLALGA